jgi:hypothetical protein
MLRNKNKVKTFTTKGILRLPLRFAQGFGSGQAPGHEEKRSVDSVQCSERAKERARSKDSTQRPQRKTNLVKEEKTTKKEEIHD